MITNANVDHYYAADGYDLQTAQQVADLFHSNNA
jgi:hypothetical protein